MSVCLVLSCLFGWLVGCLFVWLFGWLVGWLVGCLVGWLFAWLVVVAFFCSRTSLSFWFQPGLRPVML